MKKQLFLILVLVSSLTAFGQSHNKGAFSFTLGYDAGAHGVASYENNGGIVNRDTTVAQTRLLHLTGSYNVFKFMSVGLDVRTGSYVEDPENAISNGNRVSLTGLNLRFYPVNREKFAWYIGPSFGFSRLEINRIYTFIISIPAQYKFKSGHFGLETGINWYFAKNFGMNFALGYTSHNYSMYYAKINDDEQDLSNYEYTLKTAGIHMNIGLAYHFGGN